MRRSAWAAVGTWGIAFGPAVDGCDPLHAVRKKPRNVLNAHFRSGWVLGPTGELPQEPRAIAPRALALVCSENTFCKTALRFPAMFEECQHAKHMVYSAKLAFYRFKIVMKDL